MKQIIWNFEKDEDFEEFSKEIKDIPEKAGYIEIEDENSVIVRIVNLNKE